MQVSLTIVLNIFAVMIIGWCWGGVFNRALVLSMSSELLALNVASEMRIREVQEALEAKLNATVAAVAAVAAAVPNVAPVPPFSAAASSPAHAARIAERVAGVLLQQRGGGSGNAALPSLSPPILCRFADGSAAVARRAALDSDVILVQVQQSGVGAKAAPALEVLAPTARVQRRAVNLASLATVAMSSSASQIFAGVGVPAGASAPLAASRSTRTLGALWNASAAFSAATPHGLAGNDTAAAGSATVAALLSPPTVPLLFSARADDVASVFYDGLTTAHVHYRVETTTPDDDGATSAPSALLPHIKPRKLLLPVVSRALETASSSSSQFAACAAFLDPAKDFVMRLATQLLHGEGSRAMLVDGDGRVVADTASEAFFVVEGRAAMDALLAEEAAEDAQLRAKGERRSALHLPLSRRCFAADDDDDNDRSTQRYACTYNVATHASYFALRAIDAQIPLTDERDRAAALAAGAGSERYAQYLRRRDTVRKAEILHAGAFNPMTMNKDTHAFVLSLHNHQEQSPSSALRLYLFLPIGFFINPIMTAVDTAFAVSITLAVVAIALIVLLVSVIAGTLQNLIDAMADPWQVDGAQYRMLTNSGSSGGSSGGPGTRAGGSGGSGSGSGTGSADQSRGSSMLRSSGDANAQQQQQQQQAQHASASPSVSGDMRGVGSADGEDSGAGVSSERPVVIRPTPAIVAANDFNTAMTPDAFGTQHQLQHQQQQRQTTFTTPSGANDAAAAAAGARGSKTADASGSARRSSNGAGAPADHKNSSGNGTGPDTSSSANGSTASSSLLRRLSARLAGFVQLEELHVLETEHAALMKVIDALRGFINMPQARRLILAARRREAGDIAGADAILASATTDILQESEMMGASASSGLSPSGGGRPRGGSSSGPEQSASLAAAGATAPNNNSTDAAVVEQLTADPAPPRRSGTKKKGVKFSAAPDLSISANAGSNGVGSEAPTAEAAAAAAAVLPHQSDDSSDASDSDDASSAQGDEAGNAAAPPAAKRGAAGAVSSPSRIPAPVAGASTSIHELFSQRAMTAQLYCCLSFNFVFVQDLAAAILQRPVAAGAARPGTNQSKPVLPPTLVANARASKTSRFTSVNGERIDAAAVAIAPPSPESSPAQRGDAGAESETGLSLRDPAKIMMVATKAMAEFCQAILNSPISVIEFLGDGLVACVRLRTEGKDARRPALGSDGAPRKSKMMIRLLQTVFTEGRKLRAKVAPALAVVNKAAGGSIAPPAVFVGICVGRLRAVDTSSRAGAPSLLSPPTPLSPRTPAHVRASAAGFDAFLADDAGSGTPRITTPAGAGHELFRPCTFVGAPIGTACAIARLLASSSHASFHTERKPLPAATAGRRTASVFAAPCGSELCCDANSFLGRYHNAGHMARDDARWIAQRGERTGCVAAVNAGAASIVRPVMSARPAGFVDLGLRGGDNAISSSSLNPLVRLEFDSSGGGADNSNSGPLQLLDSALPSGGEAVLPRSTTAAAAFAAQVRAKRLERGRCRVLCVFDAREDAPATQDAVSDAERAEDGVAGDDATDG